MDKKTYVTPQVEIINVDTNEMLAASMGIHSDIEVQSSDQLGNTRRGEWGNRWVN